MFFLIEVVAPVSLFALFLFVLERSSHLRAFLASDFRRLVIAGGALLIGAYAYWYGVSSLFYITYRRLADQHGAEDFPYPSWDVNLSYTLSLDLMLVLGLVGALLVWRFISIHRSRLRAA